MFTHVWPIPNNVSIAMTNRHGGVSHPPFDSLNLGTHVGDVVADVLANRQILQSSLKLSTPITWLEQVHGTDVLDLAELNIPPVTDIHLNTDSHSNTGIHSRLIGDENLRFDAVYTNLPNRVCAVMTADCLPILLCDTQGTEVAAVHAGWRGLCHGVIEATVAKFQCPTANIIAYLGPAIGPLAFEVGAEVREAFCAKDADAAQYFCARGGKFLANLEGLAQLRLQALGIHAIHSASVCTFTNLDYFSYRRGSPTGRMASLVWLKPKG
ncbi:peptidoglycan editing factor PgeF [Shewanella sp. SR44-3]|uniref:peptidoglycan editing factor PgeF n=1 Tax=unclassified Shewanella TaxID=196818 RepID=UPI0015FE377E|nr:peptidoglycan editing factor PgeF [Shewanella sp. SR44-3]MBB1270497.1 peptidoglycan editing factor PgeF [Shewanella sp. SR44-3]